MNFSGISLLTSHIKAALFISFIPCPLMITLHILSYRKLTQSAQLFNLDTTRVRNLKKVRQTFYIVVITFFVLTVPTQIYSVTLVVMLTFYQQVLINNYKLFFDMGLYFNLLNSFNCCANPFIYAKIHRRFKPCLDNASCN